MAGILSGSGCKKETGSEDQKVKSPSINRSEAIDGSSIAEDLDAILSRDQDGSEQPEGGKEFARNGAAEEQQPVITSPTLSPPLPPPSMRAKNGNTIQVRMQPSLRDIGRQWEASAAGRRNFTMPLPDGSEVTVKVDRFVAIGEDGGEFEGSLEGYPDSSVRLSYRGLAEVGTLRIPSENRMIQILPAGEGELVISETEIPDEGSLTLPPGLTIPDEPPPDFVPEPPAGFRNPDSSP